jgi:hypothetical protein
VEGEEEVLGFLRCVDGQPSLANPPFEWLKFASAEGFAVVNGLAEERPPLLKKVVDHLVSAEGVLQPFCQCPQDVLRPKLLNGKVAVQVLSRQRNP